MDNQSWIFTEPNPYNPPGNLRVGEAPTLAVDLTSGELPSPRLKPDDSGVVYVEACTDLKLHDICAGPGDPNIEPLDMNQPAGSATFFAGNRKFLTKKLWGAANEPPFFHHGQFTTMREALLAHSGEALGSRQAFQALSKYDQDSEMATPAVGGPIPMLDAGGVPSAGKKHGWERAGKGFGGTGPARTTRQRCGL